MARPSVLATRHPLLRGALALASLSLVGGFAAILMLAPAGCLEGRFPTCKDNAECVKATDGGASVCYDLRCVECHYDIDCPPGKACTTSNTCEGLGTGGGEDAGSESTKWEISSWDDCARDCKDPSCVKSCDARFPKPPKDAKAPKPKPK